MAYSCFMQRFFGLLLDIRYFFVVLNCQQKLKSKYLLKLLCKEVPSSIAAKLENYNIESGWGVQKRKR